MKFLHALIMWSFSLLFFLETGAQVRRYTLSGHVREATTGNTMAGATIHVMPHGPGAISDASGFYSLLLPEGEHHIGCDYLGYAFYEEKITLDNNKTLNINLIYSPIAINDVIISSMPPNDNVITPKMSVTTFSPQFIKSIPALMGEVDVIKAIQLTPGVQHIAEGSSGFSVRGSNYDQNLILFDDATIYNVSHLMGFFSIFNNDIVRDVTLYKGDIPPAYGGRLSSLLDVQVREGNNEQFSATGGIGFISSRLTLEGPVAGERASVLVSGRRSYFELFKPFSNDLRDKIAYFYDLNLKASWRIDANNRISLSGYMGEDKYGMEMATLNFGNKAYSLRWSHTFNPRFYSAVTFTGTTYDYDLSSSFIEQMAEKMTANMDHYGVKADFNRMLGGANHFKFGYHIFHHSFMPGYFRGTSFSNILAARRIPEQNALEQAAYISNESNIKSKLNLKYGVRFTGFHNISNGVPVYYLQNDESLRTETYRKGRIYHNRFSWEPRLGILYLFDNRHSLKASYTRTSQFIQMASNSSAGSPFDVWFQASQNVRPQLSDQYALGYYRNFANNHYEFSAEAYYKNFWNAIDFKDHARFLLNDNIEKDIRFGRGYAYGFELMLRKNRGRLSGWIAYSFVRSMKKTDRINDGRRYRAPFDKPVNISIVANYAISPRWKVSGTWICYSGTPTTFPVGRFRIHNNYMPIYGKRNADRFPTYHRLDLSTTWNLSRPGSKCLHNLDFSLYNAYGRKNPWMIYFKWEEAAPDILYGEMIYLFAFVPSVTWNFRF